MTAVIGEATRDRSIGDETSPYNFDYTESGDSVEVYAIVPMIGPIRMGRFTDSERIVAAGGSGQLLRIAESNWKASRKPSIWNP